MRNIIFGFFFFIISTISYSQGLKIITPTVNKWDISQKNQDDFVKAGSLFAKIMRGEKKEESLTSEEKKLLSKFDDIEIRGDFFETEPAPCSWYCGGNIDTAYSSSELKSLKDINYSAINIHDFDASTAWVEGIKGYGIGEKLYVEFVFEQVPISITTLKIYNGYMKSEKAWSENSRVRTFKLYVNNSPYALLQLDDVAGEQVFSIDTFVPTKNKPLKLTFEIYDVYKGTKYDETAISEINFDGGGVHCFAAKTLVKMGDGGEKPIETIKIGDEVLTYNFELEREEKTKVETVVSVKHHNMVRLGFDGKEITVTNDHPFYIKGKGWCTVNGYANSITTFLGEISKLEIGDGFVGTNGETFELKAITPLQICVPTYTITRLKNGNSFFANGLLVAVE